MSALAPSALLLSATGLEVRAGERALLAGLTLELRAGEFIAVLGRNGSGKSLTLHTLAGLRAPAAGGVQLGGTPLAALARSEIARHLAFLPQDREDALPLSVFEATHLGRHPHIGWLGRESAGDLQVVRLALSRTTCRSPADSRPSQPMCGWRPRSVASKTDSGSASSRS